MNLLMIRRRQTPRGTFSRKILSASAKDCAADELVELFARIPVAYIADGHHRSAAAARYAVEDHVVSHVEKDGTRHRRPHLR